MSTLTFKYGRYEYEYALVRQARKTISLTVDPSLRIIVKAPLAAEKRHIERFLKKKWMWLEKQLSFFEKYQMRTSKREYISGESYLYLGRQYQLVVNKGNFNKVIISKRTLVLTSTTAVSDQKANKKILDAWYSHRREIIFNKCYEEVLSKFGYSTRPTLEIRSMPKRWGSYVRGEKIILNPLLIQAPKDAIEYVIAHELCHMQYKNHDKNFYELLESKVPDWKDVKERLEVRVSS